jgi:hypothetical protein
MFMHQRTATQLSASISAGRSTLKWIRSSDHCSGAAGQGRGGGHAELVASKVTYHRPRARIVQSASASSICLAQVFGSEVERVFS